MYLLCSCGAVFARKGRSSPMLISQIKHFKIPEHYLIKEYTFLKNIPEPYFVIKANRKILVGNEFSKSWLKIKSIFKYINSNTNKEE